MRAGRAAGARQGRAMRASTIHSATSWPKLHGDIGDVAAGFAEADVVHDGTYTTQRLQHAAAGNPCRHRLAGRAGVLHIRRSTQTPFLTRDALVRLFDLPREPVRVFCERVGGGFGGKQEMLVEDIVALAVLHTGRPVRLEFTRAGAVHRRRPTRHPMRVTVKVGATRDGTLTAMQLRVVSNAGAYGNHSAGVLFHGCGECDRASIAAPTRRSMALRVYTNTLPAGAFRGYGLSQTDFAVESAMDELARGSASIRSSCAAATWSGPAIRCCRRARTDDVEWAATASISAWTWWNRRCNATTVHAAAGRTGRSAQGMALAMIHTIPPRGHFAEAGSRSARRAATT